MYIQASPRPCRLEVKTCKFAFVIKSWKRHNCFAIDTVGTQLCVALYYIVSYCTLLIVIGLHRNDATFVLLGHTSVSSPHRRLPCNLYDDGCKGELYILWSLLASCTIYTYVSGLFSAFLTLPTKYAKCV